MSRVAKYKRNKKIEARGATMQKAPRLTNYFGRSVCSIYLVIVFFFFFFWAGPGALIRANSLVNK